MNGRKEGNIGRDGTGPKDSLERIERRKEGKRESREWRESKEVREEREQRKKEKEGQRESIEGDEREGGYGIKERMDWKEWKMTGKTEGRKLWKEGR